MTPSWRNLARLLCLVIVTAFTGTLLGPVIRGGFGYTWGYLGGIFGPLAMLALAMVMVGWEWRYGDRDESESTQDARPGDTPRRRDVDGDQGRGRAAGPHRVRRRARSGRRAPARR